MGADADADFSLGGLSEEQAAVYDRQLRVWGVEAQKRLGGSKFFVAGLTGLASEACKNVVLAGVGTVLLYDDGTPAAEAAPGNFLAGAGAADGAVRCATRPRQRTRDTIMIEQKNKTQPQIWAPLTYRTVPSRGGGRAGERERDRERESGEKKGW